MGLGKGEYLSGQYPPFPAAAPQAAWSALSLQSHTCLALYFLGSARLFCILKATVSLWPYYPLRNYFSGLPYQMVSGVSFLFFWWHYFFVIVHRLSLVAANGATLHCSVRASHRNGVFWGALAVGTWASVVPARELSSCGTQASCSMAHLPGAGIGPVSPALARGFLATVPPEKSY